MNQALRVAFVLVVVVGLLAAAQRDASAQAGKKTWAIVVHGGAGGGPPPGGTRSPREDSLQKYLNLARQMLSKGASALDTCEAVVRAFEDDPLFNAGKGAVYTAEGKHSLDASIMDGSTLRAGAVGGVRTIKNPISAARLVMDKTKHILLIRDGAEEFAQKMGLEIVPNSYFDTPKRKKELEEKKSTEGGGTVGCVCLDEHGNLAAATSTGGISGVMPGRVGDTPICGAGTYANKRCAVSGTGVGEQFIRYNVGYRVAALMEYKNMTATQAAAEVVHKVLSKGNGGIIVVSATGEIAMPYNTVGMARGCADSSGRFEYGIGKELKKE